MGKQWLTLFFWAPKSLQMVIRAMKLKDAYSLEEKLCPTRQLMKKQIHYFAKKIRLVKAMVFPVVMYGCELDYKESWAPKNWCFPTVMLEKTPESPLDNKEIKPVNPKEIIPEYSLEGLMLKLQYFGHLMQRADSWKRSWCWERAGGEAGDRGWDG